MKRCSTLLFCASRVALLSDRKLSRYEQEAYESHRRFVESQTYPGPIRAATPGDTRFYTGGVESILQANDRHYWRSVVDDPLVEFVIPLRIRFKTFVWVTSGWEERLQVVQVMISRDATVQQLVEQVLVENQSPYLCTSSFRLSVEGKELALNKKLSDYGIDEHTPIDAVDENNHLENQASHRPKDWNVDEITAEDAAKSPYKEMHMNPEINLAPRYEGKPAGYKGRNNFGGMRAPSA